MKELNRYKTPQWTAWIAAVFCGILTHGFALVNILHNNDDIAQQPYGYGTGITSGRWLLTILGDFTRNNGFDYNLPWVNGLLFLLLISLTAAVAVSALNIRSRRSAGLMGALFVVFPTVAATMFFRYTVVYYGLSLLLAVLAVWVWDRHPWGMLLSAVLLALSMGIYQAYIPMSIVMFVLLLIRRSLEGEGFWPLVRRGLCCCATLLLGLLLYYAVLKLCLVLFQTELSDYNGVDSMGRLSLSALPGLLKEAMYSSIMLPVKNYCGLADLQWIRYAYAGIYGISILLAGYLLWRLRSWLSALAAGVLAVLFFIAVNFIVVMCPDGWIYTLMVYPFVMLGCAPLVLLECVRQEDPLRSRAKGLLEKVITGLLCVLIFCYAYDTNINYTACYYANRQTENYLNSIVVQVRMTDGFDTDKEWAFLGKIDDPLLRTPWQYEVYFGGNESSLGLINRETRNDWLWHYFGYFIPVASEEKAETLWKSEEVQQMPCWPAKGSVKAIGDTMVIKFQEYTE